MSSTLQFLLLTGTVILAAKSGGLLSARLGQPAVLGELIAGLVLGPTGINLLSLPLFSDQAVGNMLLELGDIGVIFLMFMAGLEVDLREMLRSGPASFLAGIFGVIAPFLLGAGTARLFGYSPLESTFVGLILTATSVSISARTLLDLDVLGSKEGLAMLGAAVLDDILAILILSLFLAMSQQAGINSGVEGIAAESIRIMVFVLVAIGFGVLLLPRLSSFINRLPVSEGVVAFVMIVTFLYAWFAVALGEVAAITGAFIAGALFARTTVRRAVAGGMHTLTYAFFVPIFLVSIGLRVDARNLGGPGLAFAAALVLVAILGKIVGCSLGAAVGGFRPREALRVGVGMISRGEVGLIIAVVGFTGGWIDPTIYATTVVMVIVTTLLAPVLLRSLFPRGTRKTGKVIPLGNEPS